MKTSFGKRSQLYWAGGGRRDPGYARLRVRDGSGRYAVLCVEVNRAIYYTNTIKIIIY